MYLHCVSGVYIIPYDVIKLLSVLGKGFCCCKFIVCYYHYCVSWVYACSHVVIQLLSVLGGGFVGVIALIVITTIV